MNPHDPYADVFDALVRARNTYFAIMRDALDAGLPIRRIVAVASFGVARHVLGADVVAECDDGLRFAKPKASRNT